MTWMAGGSLALSLVLMLGLLALIASQGLGFFWQDPLVQFESTSGATSLGEIWGSERVELASGEVARTRVKIGNRDLYGLDFRWIDDAEIRTRSWPADAVVLERLEWGDFFGYFDRLETGGETFRVHAPPEVIEALWKRLQELREKVADLAEEYGLEPSQSDVNSLAELLNEAIAHIMCFDPDTDDHLKVHLQLEVLANIDALRALGCPILLYAARKPERLARILMAEAVLRARPDYVRTHEPEIIQRLLAAARETAQ